MPDSKLRKLLVDLMFYRASDESILANLSPSQHSQFISDFANKHYERDSVDLPRRQRGSLSLEKHVIGHLYHEPSYGAI